MNQPFSTPNISQPFTPTLRPIAAHVIQYCQRVTNAGVRRQLAVIDAQIAAIGEEPDEGTIDREAWERVYQELQARRLHIGTNPLVFL